MSSSRDTRGAVYITLGKGVEFGINSQNRLVLQSVAHGRTEQVIDLGPATGKRFDDIQGHMERMRIHLDEDCGGVPMCRPDNSRKVNEK